MGEDCLFGTTPQKPLLHGEPLINLLGQAKDFTFERPLWASLSPFLPSLPGPVRESTNGLCPLPWPARADRPGQTSRLISNRHRPDKAGQK